MPKKFIFFSILLFLVFFAFAKNARALDVTAANLELATVQAAVNQVNAAGGGTVYLPAGTSPYWGSSLYSYGGVNIIGAGSPNTTRDPSTHKWGSAPTTILRSNVTGLQGIIFINDAGVAKDLPFRIANISFLSEAATPFKSAIVLRSGGIGFRIDHCDFDSGYLGFAYILHIGSNWTGKASTGVIDHCNFRNGDYAISISRRQFIQSKPLGTSDAVFVEDNYFDNIRGHAISGFAAAHWVFRYNWVADNVGGVGGLDVHGPGWDEDPNHGGGPWEIYENDFVGLAGASPLHWGPARLRSSFGVIFNNRYSYFRHASQYDYDGTTLLDCPGRSGTTTLGIYVWGNTYTGMNSSPDEDKWHWIENMYCFQQNYTRYDYELLGYNDGRDGNTGVQKPGYTPYTYPHPLRNEGTSDTTPPAAPSGVVVQ